MSIEDQIPSLRTERLCLSSFAALDADDVYSYAKDPKIAETVTWDAHKSREDSLEFINFVLGRTCFVDSKVFLPWAIRDASTGKAIGSISFSQYSDISAQIDYALAVSYWGQGLVTEAAAQVIQWVFKSYPKLSESKPVVFRQM